MVLCNSNISVISRVPSEWHGLFRNLNRSVEKGIQWYIDEMSSEYGCKPTWFKLITGIVEDEPSILDNKLVFHPRFLNLPCKLQNNFVEFLHHEAYIIPDRYLKQFVLVIIKHTNRHSGLYDQIVQLAKKSKDSDQWLVEPSNKIDDTTVDEDIDITRENGPDNKTEEGNEESSFTGSQECIIINISDSDSGQEPEAKRRKLDHVIEEAPSSDEININHDELLKDKTEVEIDDVGIKDDSDPILGVNMNMVTKLREVWQNCAQDLDTEEFKGVSKLTLKEIEEFCRLIDFDSMSDDSVELICEHLCTVSDVLSFDNAVVILRNLLGTRVIKLTQNASRKLSGAVTLVSKNYPKHTVESIIIPCMESTDLNSAQSEMLCKILKGLSTHCRGYFVQKFVSKKIMLTEFKIPVLQLVIDNGCEMNNDMLTSLIQSFEDCASHMSNNLKFGKLLLAIVNKLNKIFTSNIKISIEVILDKHDTFLKKSILNAMNKLKI
ncbi:hypothetical protein ACF0H5_016302 [Mactra antiquata]